MTQRLVPDVLCYDVEFKHEITAKGLNIWAQVEI